VPLGAHAAAFRGADLLARPLARTSTWMFPLRFAINTFALLQLGRVSRSGHQERYQVPSHDDLRSARAGNRCRRLQRAGPSFYPLTPPLSPYEAPIPERAGRLPLGQASKREEAGLSVTGYPQNGAPLPESRE
jgi:hypothetical protein